MSVRAKLAEKAVPFAVTQPDRIPAKRYYDREFYELEKERLWPRVWQMACRLEEIPAKGDFVVYDIFDQSVIVTRIDDHTVKAYHNHCRHRGVQLVKDRGRRAGGFVCPFHGWRWDLSGKNTFVFEPEAFSQENMCESDLDLREVRVETWGGCAFINFDDNAPPLRPSLGPFGERMEAWNVDDLRTEWWLSARLPCNWKLAMEAFHEGYHVATTHPQLLPPGVSNKPGESRYVKIPDELVTNTLWYTMAAQMPTEVEAQKFIDMNVHFMQVLSEGMAGMTHQREVDVARRLAGLTLPKNAQEASVVWRKAVNDAVMDYYHEHGVQMPDLNMLDAKSWSTSVNFCFPHYFLLPTFGSASSYRIRPLGPEETLFELWSLTRFPKGEEPPRILTPEPMAHDDPRWPPIPKQDFSNLPRQQRGLHTGGFEFMRLSKDMEGLISNYQRLIDGYLAGYDDATLLEAVQKVSGPIDMPVLDLGF